VFGTSVCAAARIEVGAACDSLGGQAAESRLTSDPAPRLGCREAFSSTLQRRFHKPKLVQSYSALKKIGVLLLLESPVQLYNLTPNLKKLFGGDFGLGGWGKQKWGIQAVTERSFATPVLRISICGPKIFDTHPTYGTRRNFSDTYERFPKLNFTKNRETRNHLHKIAESITAGRRKLSDRSFTERK
jgi:hypothetical protein